MVFLCFWDKYQVNLSISGFMPSTSHICSLFSFGFKETHLLLVTHGSFSHRGSSPPPNPQSHFPVACFTGAHLSGHLCLHFQVGRTQRWHSGWRRKGSVWSLLKMSCGQPLMKMPLPKSGAIGWRDVLGLVAVLFLFPSKPCPCSSFALILLLSRSQLSHLRP